MIPPEPGPDPPVPVLGYTYESAIPVTINDTFPGMIYTNIKYGNDDCYLTGYKVPLSKEASRTVWLFNSILVYTDVSQEVHNCFARAGTLGYNVVLDDNSGIGLTVPTYFLSNDGAFDVDPTADFQFDSSVPSGYYAEIVSGDYVLTQRS